MSLYDLIMKRRSVRNFKEQEIPERVIEALLDAANNAQFLFKLRYPSDAMVKMNEGLFRSFKNAGFDFS